MIFLSVFLLRASHLSRARYFNEIFFCPVSQNHEQHERRWAPGTFLAAVHTRVGNPVPFDYCLWLSLNPENDSTAIWVERKFDMPNAGAWASERVFSIPLVPGAASRSPGLVVFECTPSYGVDDEIEKCVLFQTGKKRELMSRRFA